MKVKIVMAYTSVVPILAFGLIAPSIDTFLEPVYAQANQTTTGNQTSDIGVGSVQELENITGLSNQTILNNTDIERPNATTGAGLEREQTTTD
jgi:hypothetical protein